MTTEQLEKLENKVNRRVSFIESYEARLTRSIFNMIELSEKYSTHQMAMIEYLKRGFFWFLDAQEAFVNTYGKGSEALTQRYIDEAMVLYDFARKTTIPFNYVWFYFLKRRQNKKTSLIMQTGVHYIVALMGGGKSSLIYHTIEKIRTTYGQGAYVNVDMENTHFDPLLQQHVRYHYRFEADDYWGSVEDEETKKTKFTQLRRFNKLWPTIVLDEWLSKMNHRMNNTSSYKELFIPFIRSLAHMRHQGIHRVYVASQLDTTDVQLMSMFKWIHEVEIDLNVSYLEWVKSGFLDKHIQGWFIYTYQVKRTKNKTDKVLVKSWYEPKTMDMTNFNSLNMAKEYDDLKYDKIDFERSHT